MRKPKKDRSGLFKVFGLITGMLIGVMLLGMPETLAFFFPRNSVAGGFFQALGVEYPPMRHYD